MLLYKAAAFFGVGGWGDRGDSSVSSENARSRAGGWGWDLSIDLSRLRRRRRRRAARRGRRPSRPTTAAAGSVSERDANGTRTVVVVFGRSFGVTISRPPPRSPDKSQLRTAGKIRSEGRNIFICRRRAHKSRCRRTRTVVPWGSRPDGGGGSHLRSDEHVSIVRVMFVLRTSAARRATGIRRPTVRTNRVENSYKNRCRKNVFLDKPLLAPREKRTRAFRGPGYNITDVACTWSRLNRTSRSYVGYNVTSRTC